MEQIPGADAAISVQPERIAKIMKEEGIRDETWKQSPVGQKTIRAIRKQKSARKNGSRH